MSALKSLALLAAVTAMAGGFSLDEASAAERSRYDYQGAAGVCQPSQPSFAANLRARPLGLANEGATTAFVTCAFRGDQTPGGRGAWQVTATVGNFGAAVRRVTCTFVTGSQLGGDSDAIYRAKTFQVAPGNQGVTFSWVPSEIAGAPESIERPAVLCSLPPRTTLHYFSTYYDEGVGN